MGKTSFGIWTGRVTVLRFGGDGSRRLRAPSLHDVLWWVLAIAIVWAGVRLFWIAVTPLSPLGEWRPAGVRLPDDRVRSALMRNFDPFNRAQGSVMAAAAPAVVTDLPLTLYGTRLNAATGAGSAILAGADGVQGLYQVGEEVAPGATLAAVAFDHVAIERGGGRELLYLDQSVPVPGIAATPGAAPPGAGAELPATIVLPSASSIADEAGVQ